MATIFQHPGGVPRYYVAEQRITVAAPLSKESDVPLSEEDHEHPRTVEMLADIVFEHGTARPVFYILNNVVYAYDDGRAVYWIDDGMPARYLHAYDGSPPSLYLCED
jgi:hypothetical protein